MEQTHRENTILIVDDEPSIVNLVRAYLEKEGFQVHTAADGQSALKAAHVFKPDLIILDIMLPGMDGLEVLAALRRESEVYVILLTAKTEELDRILGLTVGADDYVTKPFSPRELSARVKAALRRLNQSARPHKSQMLTFPHLRIDPGARQVWVDDSLIELTQREYDLLEALARHPNIVLSREQLLEQVWGGEYFGEMRVVDVHLGHIRQKLGINGLITTVRGVGYRLESNPTPN
ncbi:MAG: response regulator transcription factor [Anaerolineales bacterium]|nr:response regulator transcription factor [Anaerolineales bacterium]